VFITVDVIDYIENIVPMNKQDKNEYTHKSMDILEYTRYITSTDKQTNNEYTHDKWSTKKKHKEYYIKKQNRQFKTCSPPIYLV
jgi:hypothetical protein